MTWHKPSGDCTCQCTLKGGFLEYRNCTLSLILRKCEPIVAADVTITATGPTGPDATPFLIEGNKIIWTKFKPAIGTWTVNVSLTCGLETFEREYTYEVTNANDFSCNCCLLERPESVIVSGHCCGFGTRTVAVQQTGLCQFQGASGSIPAPASPCSSFCFSFFAPQLNETFYVSPQQVRVLLETDTTFRPRPTLLVEFLYWAFSINNGQCVQRDINLGRYHAYRFDTPCSNGNGNATYAPNLFEGSDGRVFSDPFNNIFFYPCTSPPIARVVWQ